MRQMGSPTIKAVWIEAYAAWLALEGSHRLVAAKQLGIVPIIDEIDYDSEATTDEIIPGSYQDNWTLDQLLETAPINDMIVFED